MRCLTTLFWIHWFKNSNVKIFQIMISADLDNLHYIIWNLLSIVLSLGLVTPGITRNGLLGQTDKHINQRKSRILSIYLQISYESWSFILKNKLLQISAVMKIYVENNRVSVWVFVTKDLGN